jgi:hypothetical protein
MPAIRESVEPIYRFSQICAHSFGFHWGNPGNEGGRVNLVPGQEGDGIDRPAEVSIDLGVGLQGQSGIFDGIALRLRSARPSGLRLLVRRHGSIAD